MRTFPYKINVAKMSHRISQMNLAEQYFTIENLMHYHRAQALQVSDLLDLAKTVKVDIYIILADILMLETEAEIFAFSRKIREMQKIGFVENTKVITLNINQQLAKIYKNTIQ